MADAAVPDATLAAGAAAAPGGDATATEPPLSQPQDAAQAAASGQGRAGQGPDLSMPPDFGALRLTD
ncbi:hypothetical protein DIE28_04605 [Paracoccus thiocyanatus]|uniref:Uncharacterized protein n=1 Tax=Paracoccus thiocyanatus TaxID=34006 RepID=A0A3D8PEQ2_9RHOB|nr:hypothetical protein DIE28_04605 [Paracoccus thiocyanatus]